MKNLIFPFLSLSLLVLSCHKDHSTTPAPDPQPAPSEKGITYPDSVYFGRNVLA